VLEFKDNHVAAKSAIADSAKMDWVGGRFTLLWGAPTVVMLLALLRMPALRAMVWTAMLACVGCACNLNARRRGRRLPRDGGPGDDLRRGFGIAWHSALVVAIGVGNALTE
jgi:hypothetical protein